MYRSRCSVLYSSTTQTWQDSYTIHVPGLHYNMVSRAMFHALNPLSSSLLVDSCPSFANSLLENVCILHFPFRQPNAGSRQLKIPLFSENGLCISPPLFKPLMPSFGHPPPPPSQFSSWGCLMSLRRVSPNGSFIVTAAGNGSWEAVDGSSLLLPPLANALFYQPRDERTAAPRPSVRTLLLWHAGCCYANRLSESSFCSSTIQKHPLQCKHKLLFSLTCAFVTEENNKHAHDKRARRLLSPCYICLFVLTFVFFLFLGSSSKLVILISACLSYVSHWHAWICFY